MAFLSAVIGVRDSSGVRVDSPDALGNYLPIVIKLGSNITSSVTQSGGVSVVTISAAGGGSVTSVTGTAPITSSGGATPAIGISAASGGAAGSMSAAHYTLVDGATDAATVSTLVKRDASGRFKAVAGVAATDVAVVSQLGGSGLSELFAVDYTAATPVDIAAGGDGSYTISGESYAAVNTTHATALAVSASGIVGKATSDASNYPVLHTTIAGLSGATVAERPMLVIMARVRRTTSGADADCRLELQLGLGAYVAADDQTQRVVLALARDGSGAYIGYGRASTAIAGGGGAYRPGWLADDMVLAFALTAGGRLCSVYAAAWGGSWPAIGAMTQITTYNMLPDTSVADAWTPSDLTLVAKWTNTGNTANEFSLTALRVLG